MLFNSMDFVWFFCIVLCFYFGLKHSLRWIVLLGASVWFYMYFIPKYILILFAIILIDYAAGLLMERFEGRRRQMILVVSVLANIGILAAFKYYNFFVDNAVTMTKALGITWFNPTKMSWLLPIGLSFHTFQSLSYTIEVYRRKTPAERHLGLYALYVLYFPQLVAGPIERPQNIIWQLKREAFVDEHRIGSGLKLMLVGYLKKCIVADQCAIVVDKVYNLPTAYHGLIVIVATFLFAIQIFCDFSGYSDIARGVSRVMGIELMINFNRPYMAQSISDFWRRWHISLSTWFRDYLYIPLGGNRVSQWKQDRNLLVVFLVSGLWHGANWTFICWGALHGSYLIFASQFGKWRSNSSQKVQHTEVFKKWRDIFSTILVFTAVCVAWVFFRANSLTDVATIFSHAFSISSDLGDVTRGEVFVALGLSGVLLAGQWIAEKKMAEGFFESLSWPWRYALYSGCLLSLLYFSQDKAQTFIYFQF